MSRAGSFGALCVLTVAMVNVETEAQWIDDHRAGLLQIAAGLVVLFLIFGAYVINRLARPRPENPPSLPGVVRSWPRSSGPVHRGSRPSARSVRESRPDRSSLGRWL